ncbi:hypothetical protein OUZ56_018459 [Daphnia magna]|uniref:50S ribosomal protein L14 n=1 Tax=Daphnia magna TaxID=35525 RepID=A0ABQ9Z8X5_9CRUS|nr:hypothetical protein OUZ56_018459 [Daphnia magna]
MLKIKISVSRIARIPAKNKIRKTNGHVIIIADSDSSVRKPKAQSEGGAKCFGLLSKENKVKTHDIVARTHMRSNNS